ncbi:amino acid transporter [Alginatibacterium sediminis]|uniref:Amino acid transporter n=1 Tax=Alginatibacterium sediminis TaxID=2164068 RepID=A0A420EHQ8_9ALTE|nr:LysE/ArgO family amino acid transporter [Alginatibacterium sediminis]RKF20235.1 amino acid transporter [Alginatibacterium sediminis]
MLHALSSGFALGFSLILAIGAQNAFVLKQGLKRQHVFAVCLCCALSDAILITAGVAGFGTIVQQFPSLEIIARYCGATFLIIYALLSLKTAFTKKHSLELNQDTQYKLLPIIATCLALTWLNPHVYLDTVVLLGSISTQYPGLEFYFGLGAVISSFVFFFSLGYGAKFLIPVFSTPKAWKVFEVIVAVLMFAIALSLIKG